MEVHSTRVSEKAMKSSRDQQKLAPDSNGLGMREDQQGSHVTRASEEGRWQPRMWEGRGTETRSCRAPGLGKNFTFYARKIYSKHFISAFTFWFNIINYLSYTKFTPDKEMGRTY